MKKKVTTAILVALIATSSSIAAFAASGKQGYISPKAILPGAITSSHIKDNDITYHDIGTGAVKTDEIADGEVNTVDIAIDAVTSDEIKANAVCGSELKTGAVKAKHIDTDAVKSSEIDTGAVRSDEIKNGEVKSAEVAKDAVNSTNIANETIDDEDLGDAAIPSVVACKPGTPSVGSTWYEDFNKSISTERKMAFVFTYAVNPISVTSGEALLAKACVIDSSNNAYKTEQSPVRVADSTTQNYQRTVTFINTSVEPGDYYVNVSIRTTGSGTTKVTDRVFTVIALPTA